MNTEMKNTRDLTVDMEQPQFRPINQREINEQFAQRIIDWYFSKYSLNWETFLEARRIAMITNKKSFASNVFQFR